MGSGVSMGLIALLSLFVTWLVHSEKAGISIMGPAAAIIQFISVFSGCMTAMIIGKEKIAILSAATAASTLIVLLSIALLVFSDGVPNFMEALVITVIASGAACLLKLKSGTGKKFHKKRRFR